MADEELILSHAARLKIVDLRELHAETVRQLTSLEVDATFLFRAEISNDLLDSHFTHMSEKTLMNYAEDAARGVAFLRSHEWRNLPTGYSLSGEYSVAGRKATIADFYTIRGLSDTDDLIRRMEANLVRDVSVGFHGGKMICDLCNQDFWECRHWPGFEYDENEGDRKVKKLATYTIENARLSEVSAVFDGSTPNAMILKAQRHAALGLIPRVRLDLIEEKYRVRLRTKNSYPVLENFERMSVEMEDKGLARLKTILVNSGIIPEDQRHVEDEESLLAFADKMAARLQTLEPQAADGRAYRSSEIERALTAGVRAVGNDFDKEGYRSMLETMSLVSIQRMASDWDKVAKAVLPAGRSSVDNDQTPVQEAEVVDFVPDSVYR